MHESLSWTFNEQKRYLHLYLKYEFKTTYGWVNDNTVFILGWTIPFRLFVELYSLNLQI